MNASGQLIISGEIIQSSDPAPQVMNAAAWNERGVKLAEERRFEEAHECFERAVAQSPEFAEAHNNLGNVLSELGRDDEALAAYEAALALRPYYRNPLRNLSQLLGKLGRTDEAITHLERMLDLDPRDAASYAALGVLLQDAGLFDRAQEAWDMTLSFHPGMKEAQLNRALVRLARGELLQGFEDYEIRRTMKIWGTGQFSCPELASVRDGVGRRVLIHREQGYGDTIQFARYALLLARAGAEVLMYAQPPLVELLKSVSGVTIIPEATPVANVERETLSMSLPRVFRTRVDTIPAEVPYVFANPVKAADWRRRLEGPGLRVGVSWCGNPDHGKDASRSFPLAAMRPLARVPGVRLISLQKLHGLDQLATLPPGMRVETLDGIETFDDTAAVMSALDLIVTCDSAPAHLAGALGRPVWIALSTPADWRWLRDRTDSPWYPTARLFRQRTAGDWASVFDPMAEALGDMLLS